VLEVFWKIYKILYSKHKTEVTTWYRLLNTVQSCQFKVRQSK